MLQSAASSKPSKKFPIVCVFGIWFAFRLLVLLLLATHPLALATLHHCRTWIPYTPTRIRKTRPAASCMIQSYPLLSLLQFQKLRCEFMLQFVDPQAFEVSFRLDAPSAAIICSLYAHSIHAEFNCFDQKARHNLLRDRAQRHQSACAASATKQNDIMPTRVAPQFTRRSATSSDIHATTTLSAFHEISTAASKN